MRLILLSSVLIFFTACSNQGPSAARSLNSVAPEGEVEHNLDAIYDLPTAEEVEKARQEVEELFPETTLKSNVSEGAVLAKYKKVYPNSLVPGKLLKEALLYFDANPGFKNRNYITIVDFAQPSWEKRMYVIQMSTGLVHRRTVAHGAGSDPNNDGYLDLFSNLNGSHASSRGFFRVAESYSGRFGYSARLDGLQSTNNAARARAVVLHGSDYVWDSAVKQGRSYGCFAISWNGKDDIVDILKSGSMLYASESQ